MTLSCPTRERDTYALSRKNEKIQILTLTVRVL